MGHKRRTPPSGKQSLLNDKIPATNRAFGGLLEFLGLSQQQAADRLRLARRTVSDYVSGKKTLFLPNYRQKCIGLGLDAATAEHALAVVAEVDGDEQLRKSTASDFITRIGRLAERLAATIPARAREAAAEQERQRLQALWRDLETLTLADWRLVVAAAAPDLQRWAFVKLVGEESELAASTDAQRALELARFALWTAERVTGEEGWVSLVFGWVFLGNARRVGGDLAGAEEAFAHSARLQTAPPEGLPELPEPWRLLDLEASLRISLRQLPEALRLLDQAVEVAPSTGSIQARLLCKRANALYRMGDLEGSIATLREALAQIDHETESRLLCMLQFNLMDRLCSVEQAAEAERMLPELRRLQAQMGNGLNQIRLRWLEGKIDAGLGRIERAVEALSWVRAAFAREGLRYDEAQAGMELAGLYLVQGRTAAVKRLVLLMEPVFRAKGVHEEARKALDLFRRAVDRETVTPELAGRVAGYLRRAQNDPELRFEEAA
jgi:tetratricopeptide (TPR) repeat protein/predicted transcriptional regulator